METSSQAQMSKTPKTNISVSVPLETKQQLKVLAAKSNTTLSALTEKLYNQVLQANS